MMKKILIGLILAVLLLSVACGKESPMDIQGPYEPPDLQEGLCPGIDQWFFLDDCTDCHNGY